MFLRGLDCVVERSRVSHSPFDPVLFKISKEVEELLIRKRLTYSIFLTDKTVLVVMTVIVVEKNFLSGMGQPGKYLRLFNLFCISFLPKFTFHTVG